MENYALVQLMKENEDEKPLSVKEAKNYYAKLAKSEASALASRH